MLVKGTISPYKTGKRWDRLLRESYINMQDCPSCNLISFTTYIVFQGRLNLGNVTSFEIQYLKQGIGYTELSLAIKRVGCYDFYKGEPLHPEYVAEKLNLCIEDANNLTDWLNIELEMEAAEYGRYNDDECLERVDRCLERE